MPYTESQCLGTLAGSVECFWSSCNRGDAYVVHPDGSADLLFDSSGRVYVSGISSKSCRLNAPFDKYVFGFRLRPGAIPHIFDQPASAFAEQITPVALVNSPVARVLCGMADRAGTIAEIVTQASDALGQHLRTRGIDRRTAVAVSRLRKLSVREASLSIGVSERQLHRIFLQAVGVSPSRFKQISRLQRLIDELRQSKPDVSLATIALDHDYFDQSHMNHDVSNLTGMTMNDLRRSLNAS